MLIAWREYHITFFLLNYSYILITKISYNITQISYLYYFFYNYNMEKINYASN